jgi:hypothetical protein
LLALLDVGFCYDRAMSNAKARISSTRIVATKTVTTKTRDDEFVALLRRKCLRAATVGAFTAAGEAIPGLSRVLGFVFGELLDARFLAQIQRELIEETFTLYELELPVPVRETLVGHVQLLGTSASVAGDAVVRQLLKRSVGRIGSLIASRVLPLTSIASSAFSNAMVTYAVGKRAQAVAQLHGEPIKGVPDALRAFSGVDERRVLDWTIEATKSALGQIGSALKNVVTRRMRSKPAKTASKRRKRKPE